MISKSRFCEVRVHIMEWRWLHALLASSLDWCEWSASRPCRFTTGYLTELDIFGAYVVHKNTPHAMCPVYLPAGRTIFEVNEQRVNTPELLHYTRFIPAYFAFERNRSEREESVLFNDGASCEDYFALMVREWQWFWALEEWYWRGNTEVLGEKAGPLPLCLPQIRHGLVLDGTQAFAVRGRRVIARTQQDSCDNMVVTQNRASIW